MSVEVDGVRLFDAVQATWNLLEPSAAPALEAAHASGFVMIIKEALANAHWRPWRRGSMCPQTLSPWRLPWPHPGRMWS